VTDPAASLAVSALIVLQAYRLMRASVEVLLESTPGDVDLASLRAAMAAVPGVSDVHDVHAWSLSSDVRALSAHLLLAGHPTLEQAQAVGSAVRAAVEGPFGLAHTTLELECERCSDEADDPCAMEVDRPQPSTSLSAAWQGSGGALAFSGGEFPAAARVAAPRHAARSGAPGARLPGALPG
jgi:hypothetical protein